MAASSSTAGGFASSLVFVDDGDPTTNDHTTTTALVVLRTIFEIVLGICQYYLPMAASVLWKFFGIATFLTDSLYLQYLYTTHLFVDEYAAALLAKLHENLTDGACLGHGGCYCPEGQELSTFFWVVFVVWVEYGFWPPPTFKSVILCTTFVSYAASLALTGTCSVSGMLFSLVVGAGLGVLKIYLYSAVFSTLVGMLARRTILARAIREQEEEEGEEENVRRRRILRQRQSEKGSVAVVDVDEP